MAGNPAATKAPTNVTRATAYTQPKVVKGAREPTPEETAAALAQGKLNHQNPVWNGLSYDYVPIAGDPANNANSAATAQGTSSVQADLLRRQAAANPFQISGTGQFGAGSTPQGTASQAISQFGGQIQQQAQPGLVTPQQNLRSNVATPTAAFSLGGGTVANPSKAEQGADQSRAALGPAPTIDMGLADRGNNTVQDALGLSQQVVNSALQPVDQTALNQATQDARSVLDQLLNGPNTSKAIGAQTLRAQLALARSAAGGPGAVQDALNRAQQQAPELQGQATQAATQEDMSRRAAAGQVAGQLQNTALGAQQNDTSRLGVAGQAASGFAQGALGAKGQDIQVAQANQTAASNLINNVAQLTGTQLELDQRNQELIGQMARDMNAMNYNWGQLSAAQQSAEFDRWVQVYGIDKNAAAGIKAAAEANKKGPMDYIIPIVGAAATVAAGALAGPPGAVAAGATTAAVSQAAK